MALGGNKLPSARNIIAIASACSVDEAPLLARRDQIARMDDVPADQPKRAGSRLVRWWWIPSATCRACIRISWSVRHRRLCCVLTPRRGARHADCCVSLALSGEKSGERALSGRLSASCRERETYRRAAWGAARRYASRPVKRPITPGVGRWSPSGQGSGVPDGDSWSGRRCLRMRAGRPDHEFVMRCPASHRSGDDGRPAVHHRG
jgi:hypothetical protein